VETAETLEIKTKLFEDDDAVRAARRAGLEPGLNWKSYLRLFSENPATLFPLIFGGTGGLAGDGPPAFPSEGARHDAGKEKWGRTLHSAKPEEQAGMVCGTSLARLSGVLRERSLVFQKAKRTTDLLYYENRNKYRNGILMPRRYYREKQMPGNVVVLLDVSGSIPSVFVEAALNAIIKARDGCNAEESRLVRWSANLMDDSRLGEAKPITGGGGTALAEGIEYCKRYTGENTAFFIISDAQDDIAAWLKSAQDMRARQTVIAYNKHGKNINAAAWFARLGSNADYRKETVSLARWTRRFDTFLVTL
jgi:hypothetical protein